ncbi:syntaxin-4 [Rhinatrema bivittatum]|uniref:syntaxin-4 n=1 Tax=Rhinatrema bivittatum TaxID=194408 RepID=UPI00112C4CF3|nr:syntaxin-4 [Rhinatrema bivittatum]
MRDRTKELRGDSDNSEDEEKTGLVISANKDGPCNEDEFFHKVKEIRQLLETLDRKVKELEKQQSTILAKPLPEEGMRDDLQKLREEIKNLAKSLQVKLKSIEPKEEEDGKWSVNLRMRKTQHGILSQLFVEVMNKCSTSQLHYRDQNVERIRRQLRITGSSVSDEELEQMLESGQGAVFTSNILKETQVTKQALNEIEARHLEILKLEKSIQELHEMFIFLSMEVEAQGEKIDSIEKNISSSTNYVEKARKQLTTAVSNQKKSRKKKLMLAICVSVVLLILIIIITVLVTTG